jgi:hypothetical protein
MALYLVLLPCLIEIPSEGRLMLRDIRGEIIKPCSTVHVFKYGDGKVVKGLGYDEEAGEETYVIRLGNEDVRINSSLCFLKRKSGRLSRRWSLRDQVIEATDEPITFVYQGELAWVQFSESVDDRECFEKGDVLHKDWEGSGIEFDVMIDKWLRRLIGERIQLSAYYRDPFNRLLDNLGG